MDSFYIRVGDVRVRQSGVWHAGLAVVLTGMDEPNTAGTDEPKAERTKDLFLAL